MLSNNNFNNSKKHSTEQPASTQDANYDNADDRTAEDTGATIGEEHNRQARNSTGPIDSDSLAESESTCHHHEHQCICGLEELLLDSLVESLECTDEEAEEMLYNYQAQLASAAELELAGHSAIELFHTVLGDPSGIRLTSLRLEKNGIAATFVPDQDQCCGETYDHYATDTGDVFHE